MESLNEEEKRWRELHSHNPVVLLRQALGLTCMSSGVEQAVSHKLYATVVLLSADLAEYLNEPAAQGDSGIDATKVLAMALVKLAAVAIKRRPIAKLVAAQLLKPLDRISIEGHTGDITGDLKVCSHELVEYGQYLTSTYLSDLCPSFEKP